MKKNKVEIMKQWFLEGANRYADYSVFRAEVRKNSISYEKAKKIAEIYGKNLSELKIPQKPTVSSWELAIKILMSASDIPFSLFEETAKNESESLIAFGCFAKELGRTIVKEACLLINPSFDKNISPSVSRINRAHKKHSIFPIMARCIEVAKKRNIPHVILTRNPAILQLGYGRKSKKAWSALTSKTTRIGAKLTANKHVLNLLLAKLDIPVSKSELISKESDLEMLLEKFQLPVVIKPSDSTVGRGVSLNIQTLSQAKRAYKTALKISKRVIMESQIEGFYYRLAFVDYKLIASAKANPVTVTGNGKSTIEQLIAAENKKPYRQDKDKNKGFYKIEITDKLKMILSYQGLKISSVPASDRITLSFSGVEGGEWVENTKSAHSENIDLIRRALKFAELDVAGVDVISPDISIPFSENGGKILEINAGPDLNIHASVNRGEKINVEEAIIDYLFPDDNGRIPIISITGTNGKTTTSKLIGHILNDPQKRIVGLATSDNKYVNGKLVAEGDKSGFLSARSILMNPEVDVAVLETCHILGIDKRGLGYDWSDASVITNLTGDHIGTFCTLTPKDLFEIKSVVARRTSPDGFLILNADDPEVVKMARLTKAKVAYFSPDRKNKYIQENIRKKWPAYYLEKNILWEGYAGKKTSVARLSDIPITLKGKAIFNIYNALGAIATIRLIFRDEITLAELRIKLKTFGIDYSANPGRFNIIEKNGFKVIIDYAHNPDGYQKTIELAKKIKHRRFVGVIKSAGDRVDDFIKELGKIAGQNFDFIYIKEPSEEKIRGRKAGNTSQLLREGALSAGFSQENIRMIPDEMAAVKKSLESAQKGDLIMVFAHEINKVIDLVTSF